MSNLITFYLIFTTFFMIFMTLRWSTDGIDGLIKTVLAIVSFIGLVLNGLIWANALGYDVGVLFR